MSTNAKQLHFFRLSDDPFQFDVNIYTRGKEIAIAFQSLYNFAALYAYKRDINLPGRLV